MNNKQEKSIGALIAKLVLIGLLMIGGTLGIMGLILGWFKGEPEIKTITLSQTTVDLEEGEKCTLRIMNIHRLGDPYVKWTVSDREIASVKDNKDGTAEVTAKAAGHVTLTLTADHCEELQCSITVRKPPIASIAGTAWETEDGDYYFLGEADYYYFIGPKTENYIKGGAQIKEVTREEMLESEAAALVDSVDHAAYFRLDVVADLEVYYGSRRHGSRYAIYVAANENVAAIYDSGWSEALPAKKIDLLTADALDGKFPGGAEIPEEALTASTANTAADGGFTMADVRFTADGTYKESVNAIQVGNELIFKRGDKDHNALYRIPLDGSGTQPTLLYQPADGRIVTVFGTDGKQVLIGEGNPENGSYGTDSLYRMDLNGGTPTLLVEDTVSDFCVMGNYIYYTDYTKLVKLSMSGSSEVLWDYGVYCYEVTDENLIFLFDGDVWELIDAKTGEDCGYLCESCNHSYECDMAEQAGDYLYYVAFDYDKETLSLHVLDIWNGTETTIGGSYSGSKHDTYCVLFYDKYAMFTTEDGESLVRIDLTNGSEKQIYLEDAGYWYANEIVLVDSHPMIYACDSEENGWYVYVDDAMSLTPFVSGF